MEFTADLSMIGIIFGAHIIKSITGFGAALISVPFLSHTYEMKHLIPMFALFDLYSGAAVIATTKKKHIDYKLITVVVLGLIAGTALGAILLVDIDNDILKKAFGVFIALFALKSIFFNDIYIKKKSDSLSVLAGFLGGLSGSLFGVNGPPIIIYLAHKIKNKIKLRNSLFVIFLVDAIWKIILFTAIGILTFDIFLRSLLLIPFIIVALELGTRINLKLKPRYVNAIIGTVLLINSYFLIFG